MITILSAVSDQSNILILSITNVLIVQLEYFLLNDFSNLTDLNLSNCFLFDFEIGTFQNTVHLISMNFSNNLLSDIADNLFATNIQLKILILKNNLLVTINKKAFSVLKNLQILDLRHNFILKLDQYCLECPRLEMLQISYNKIEIIEIYAFKQLPNLTDLALDNNKINDLDVHIFGPESKLQYLNLSHNMIERLRFYLLWKLPRLKGVYLNNNLLTQVIDSHLFPYNCELTEIDLSNNEISVIKKRAFNKCLNLESLSLSVHKHWQYTSLKQLTSLKKFDLFYKSYKKLRLTPFFWDVFKFKLSLTLVKLIFQKIYGMSLCIFSSLKNLECLHIECKEPSARMCNIDFGCSFYKMSKLSKLILKKLNSFHVSKCSFYGNEITHLNLSGIKNETLGRLFWNYMLLEYLDLSFSEIEFIHEDAFEFLVNLEHLEFGYSKLKFIEMPLFRNTRKLQILNCSNCRLEMIEDYSFQTLHNLLILDLSYNLLKHMTENVFFGLNQETCIFIL